VKPTDLAAAFEPAYLSLLRRGELSSRIEQAYQHLEDCDLCARYCHMNRRETIKGAVCRTGERAVVNSFGPHHGEEDSLRGTNGSGTIFFSWCNLRCVFCQNWEISHKGMGREVEPDELADMMLNLQERGCHNINFVTPSHVVAQIIAAVDIAAQKGLRIPLVYNTGGYDSPEALALLDGIIDIYMPDMKYGDSAIARKYSKVRTTCISTATVLHYAVYWFATWYCRIILPVAKQYWLFLPKKYQAILISTSWINTILVTVPMKIHHSTAVLP
jgi:putative pyruvate formate lyase activating enzyme